VTVFIFGIAGRLSGARLFVLLRGFWHAMMFAESRIGSTAERHRREDFIEFALTNVSHPSHEYRAKALARAIRVF
jgi:hypothetical protein